jgi:hypothetical protein
MGVGLGLIPTHNSKMISEKAVQAVFKKTHLLCTLCLAVAPCHCRAMAARVSEIKMYHYFG